MDRIERRLVARSTFLSYGGRLTLVNVVFSALPTFYMSSLKLPVVVIAFIDRARCHCLWRGNDLNSKGNSLVAWDKICKSKGKGGMGVINLRLQNEAILLKRVHKFYNKHDLPWVHLIKRSYYQRDIPHASKEVGSYWWKDTTRLSNSHRGIAACSIGVGDSALFWDDVCNGNLLASKFLKLCSYAKNRNISIKDFVITIDITELFHLPLPGQAFAEYEQLQHLLHQMQDNGQEQDAWTYIWGNGAYSSQRYCKFIFQNINPPQPFKWIWKRMQMHNETQVLCLAALG